MGILQAIIQEWVPFPSPGDLPNPGIKPKSPTLQADTLPTEALVFWSGKFQGLYSPWGHKELDMTKRCLLLSLSSVQFSSVQSLSRVRLFETPWTVACQAPLSMGILQARILEWVAIPFSRDLPDPGLEPTSPVCPALQAPSLPVSHRESPAKPRWVKFTAHGCKEQELY